jgi:1-acyl-sn-glycerol-3-phosphate acyltransferase
MKFGYFLMWAAVRAVGATYLRWRVYHPERAPVHGPAILAANHASFLDPLLIGGALPRELHYLARESLFRNPILNVVLRHWNCVPVDRDGGGAAGLKGILDRLRRGGAIVLFPEGTRTRDGGLQPARAGVGLAVIKSDCPVVPVRVFGTWEAFGRRHRFPRPHPVRVKFGNALLFAELRAEAKTCAKPRLKAIYQQVADEIIAAIARLEPCGEVSGFP